MHEYGSNKIRTVLDSIRRIENWPTAIDLRLRRRHPGVRLLRFRNGPTIVCRGATRDWDVVHELLFAGGYRSALDYLRQGPGPKTVVDLGGNIGLFSLLAASQRPDVTVHAYEPGPPNYRLFEVNRLLNAPLSDRIHLHREAVAGETRTARWFFDEYNPGASSLFATKGESVDVRIVSFSEAMAALPKPLDLVKIDVEGSEFELLERTPVEAWKDVRAISLELHDDPRGQMPQDEFMRRMTSLGFVIVPEKVCSYFLYRRQAFPSE